MSNHRDALMTQCPALLKFDVACSPDALIPSAPIDRFGSDHDVLKYFPSAEDLSTFGSLALALANNGVAPPYIWCCGAANARESAIWM